MEFFCLCIQTSPFLDKLFLVILRNEILLHFVTFRKELFRHHLNSKNLSLRLQFCSVEITQNNQYCNNNNSQNKNIHHVIFIQKTCNFNTIGKNNHFFSSAKTFVKQNRHSPQTAHFTGICHVIRHRKMQNIPKFWQTGELSIILHSPAGGTRLSTEKTRRQRRHKHKHLHTINKRSKRYRELQE